MLLVTGAAAGSIGGCTAVRAAREGAAVPCVDRKVPQLNKTVEEIASTGGKAIPLVADVPRATDGGWTAF